jgi:hypothetical protein
MKTFAAFLLLVCSGMAFGQDVTIDHIELTQTMIEGVDDLTIAAELVNNHHEAITVRDASFSLVSQGGDTFESYVGTNETDGINFALGERINPGVTADHMLFFRVPSTINLHEPLKLRLGGHWMWLYGPVADMRPNPTNAVQHYIIGDAARAPTKPEEPLAVEVSGGAASQPSDSREAAYDRYTNERFGFSIQYPHSFKRHREPENGDGLGFTSADGTATLTASGSYDEGESVEAMYQEALKEVHGSLGYTKLASTWFVITWKDGPNISYEKTFVGAVSQNTFILTYPQTQKAAYADTVIHIGKSFQPGNLSAVDQ